MSADVKKLLARALFGAVGVLGLVMVESSAYADDQIRLATGEVLTVKILETTESTIKFVHPVLGEMTLARANVEVLPPPPAPPAPPAPRSARGERSRSTAPEGARCCAPPPARRPGNGMGPPGRLQRPQD